MYCDVLFEKFKNVDVNEGIECIIDREQVLLKKEGDIFKYHPLNKSKSSYLNGAKSAKFKHVDNLIENKDRKTLSNCNLFEETYNRVRLQFKG